VTQHTLRLGDCREILQTLPDASVDAVVTDPPYGLAFMGKRWDYDVPSVEIWAECLRVLKPGGHLLAFAGTRTQHRMAVRIEDAGFEIRDMIAWVYGSGFPKSLDVSKAIDKAAGAEREVVGQRRYGDGHVQNSTKLAPPIGTFQRTQDDRLDTAPATPEAQQWAGWGTALKPALEPVTMARKPLTGTVAANVLEHGTGALNVDGCRVPMNDYDRDEYIPNRCGWKDGAEYSNSKPPRGVVTNMGNGRAARGRILNEDAVTKGRWPANLIHDGSDEVVGLFPAEARSSCGGGKAANAKAGYSGGFRPDHDSSASQYFDSGSAARFFYTAKATKAERQGVTHPTVKPLDLMAYLCRLVTPPGGTVLDPFMGSGTTIKAAIGEGFNAIGIERDPAYFAMAEHRMNGAQLGLLLTP
jgi:site-specific DNA-methyltransferase (adenine-specific)